MPYVKPTGGVVPHPERGMLPLAAEGDHVPATPYWTRRIRAGDVVEADPLVADFTIPATLEAGQLDAPDDAPAPACPTPSRKD